ncbi:MAG: DUF1080 domain-containing protein [Planctomycetes bacterium]|nr:DUF1080 domain-containing protein [Planctomycetota bacterium]
MYRLFVLAVIAATCGAQGPSAQVFEGTLTGLEQHVAAGGGCVVLLDTVGELTSGQASILGLQAGTRVAVADGLARPERLRIDPASPVTAMVAAGGWKGRVASVPRSALKDGLVLLADGDRPVTWVREHGKARVVATSSLAREHDAVGAVHRLRALAWAGRAERPGRPKDATVLFYGGATDHWVAEKGGGPCAWKVVDGALEVTPGKGSIMTRETYGDFRMHVEFKVPEGKGNSGVYLQRRYEVQILNTPSLEPKPHFCGSLYRYRKPDVNAALPVGVWQTYDIRFRQPRWKGEKKTEDARITVVHNGIVVHDDFELARKTGAGKPEGPKPMPILLQDHGWKIRFRNLWIQRLGS